MALLFEAGTFTKPNATTGNQTVTQPVGDFSSGPVLLLLWTSGATGASPSFTADIKASHGAAARGAGAAYTERAAGFSATDAASPTESSGRYAAACITIANAAGSGAGDEANIVSIGNGQFIINWSVCSARQVQINYLLIGGLTDAICIDAANPTATGNKDYTSSSFGTPDFAIVSHAALRSGVGDVANAFFGWGFVNATESIAASAAIIDNAVGVSDTARLLRTDAAAADVGQTSGIAPLQLATVVGMITDGVRLNYSAAGFSGAQNAGFAVLVKGLGTKIGTVTIGASPQTVTHGSPKIPAAILSMGVASTNVNPAVSDQHQSLSIGVTDGATEVCAGTTATDNGAAGSNDRCFGAWRTGKSFHEFVVSTLAEHSGTVSAIGATTYTLTHDMSAGLQFGTIAFYDPGGNTHQLVNAA